MCPTPGTILFLRIWQTFWAFWARRRCCCCCLRSACAHCAPVCNAPDALGCNICVGIFAALFLQCVINIGMNLQVLPVIGVTLPFFSAGGSSVVMMYLCVGIVLSVGMNTRRSKLEMQQIL